ncbi:MAG: hypothetical protein V4710_16975, partial [Verrucomicrobiota bacterium]
MKFFPQFRRLSVPAVFALYVSTAPTSGLADGFTEPPITFYGRVTQVADGYTIPVTSGTITWTIQPAAPANAQPVIVTAAVSGTGGASFYRLKIPVEKVPPALTVSAGSINAPGSSVNFHRGTVRFNGETPLLI